MRLYLTVIAAAMALSFGATAADAAYLDTLNGRVPPDQGVILSL